MSETLAVTGYRKESLLFAGLRKNHYAGCVCSVVSQLNSDAGGGVTDSDGH